MNDSIRITLALALCGVFFDTADCQESDGRETPRTQIRIDSVDLDYSEELPRLPALDIEPAAASFEVASGFELQLVASEPLVSDPVAICFDARNRLFVVEMRDYSEQATESLGRIALLEDTNDDGVMDLRHEFATGLSWPSAIWPWKEGVLVAHPPYLSWLGDPDGDNRAEIRRDWFTGFGRSNVQGLVNSLRWSPTGFIVGATSSSAATLTPGQNGATESPLHLKGRDFAIDPLDESVRAMSGGGQHGLFVNAWGDKFVTSNSDHLQQVIDLESWASKYGDSLAMPSVRRSIALDGPQAEVFRISPVEPWRVVRTRLRAKGVVRGIVEGGGRAAGYFTGATGTCILPAAQRFGVDGFDTALVCDVGSNLVHRKQMVDQGLFWSSDRIDEGSELLQSRDTWFRPVQLTDGPDGAVYIADMYREVIEHPKSLPPVIKQHLDLTSGRDRGRIYRLSRIGSKPVNAFGSLADLPPERLCGELASSISWRRLMASQLILQWASGPVEPAGLRNVLGVLRERAVSAVTQESEHEAVAVILASHLLSRLDAYDVATAQEQLRNVKHARCIEHVLNLCGQHALLSDLDRASLESWQETLIGIPLAEPRLQLAMSKLAASCTPDLRSSLVENVITALEPSQPSPPLVLWALAEVGDAEILASLEAGASVNEADLRMWINWLLPSWIDRAKASVAARIVLHSQIVNASSPNHSVWMDEVVELSAPQRAKLFDALGRGAAAQVLADASIAVNRKPFTVSGVKRLRMLTAEEVSQWINENYNTQLSSEVAAAILACVREPGGRGVAGRLIEQLGEMTPPLRMQLLGYIGERAELIGLLAEKLKSGQVAAAWIPVAVQRQMLQQASGPLRRQLEEVFDHSSSDRVAVIDRYWTKIQSLSDQRREVTEATLEAGGRVFAKSCAQCHRIRDTGADVGPPLKQLALKSPRELVETILAPSREVDPKYLGYKILLEDGRALVGIVTDESAGQLSLRQAGGKLDTVFRRDIEIVQSTDKSLMPEGIEQEVTPEQMYDLVQYLRQASQ